MERAHDSGGEGGKKILEMLSGSDFWNVIMTAGGRKKFLKMFFRLQFLECAYDCGGPQKFVYMGDTCGIHGGYMMDTW